MKMYEFMHFHSGKYIGSDNGLSPGRHQIGIWTNTEIGLKFGGMMHSTMEQFAV